MGKKNSRNNSGNDSAKRVYLHQARLMELLQTLKNQQAEISLNLDINGQQRKTTYGVTDQSEYTLKELLYVVWSEDLHEKLHASEYSINEYFRSDYEFDSRSRGYAYLPPNGNVEESIKNITAEFRQSKQIQNRDLKQITFFDGHLPQSTNLLAVFPDFRTSIKQRIDRFVSELTQSNNGFPYLQLRNDTGQRCHRYKSIEKDIFQHIKDTDPENLTLIRENLISVMSAYSLHLEQVEASGLHRQKPEEGKFLTDKLSYKELSNPKDIDIDSEEVSYLDSLGFQYAFKDKESWFDKYRFKKMQYWIDNLSRLDVDSWPEFYLEHILLSYFELNAVCSELVQIRESIFHEIGFRIVFSKDGVKPSWNQYIDTLDELAGLLSNYEYVSNAFVERIHADGHLLREPLFALPEPLRQQNTYPDHLYFSRVEKLLWKYLLGRLCECCEVDKTLVEGYYVPLSKRM